jgi:hypothetical protein
MSSFRQILAWSTLHGALLFALLWLTITAVAAICVASSLRPATTLMSERATRRPIDIAAEWRQVRTATAVVMLTVLGVFIALYVATILIWEDFAYYDDSMLTLSTLKGHNFTPAIWPESGRFFPLALQEFNLIRHFTHTAAGYHVITVAQLLVFCGILLIIDDELNLASRAALVILALLTPSVFISFSGFTWQERDFLFFLACFLSCVKRFEQTRATSWAIATVVFAQIMIYCKETAFLLLLGFVVSRLILRCKNASAAKWEFRRLWVLESRLDLGLAALALLFVLLYFEFVGHGNLSYAVSAEMPWAEVVLGYARVDLLPWLLVAVLLGRLFTILWHRAAPLLFWDALAAGGVACFLGYLYLRMFSGYYLAPVDLIAVLYVGRIALLSWKKMPSWGKKAALLLTFIIIMQDVGGSTFALYERKNVIQGKVQIASIVEAEYRRHPTNNIRLFFPFAGGEQLMEFGAYLSYRGIPVGGAADEIVGVNSVVLAEALRTHAKYAPGRPAEDAPCVEWTKIWCEFVNGPTPGDLVIVLPDDEASFAEASAYRNEGVPLLYARSRLPTPRWLRWLFDSLPLGEESRYRDSALPDRWMDASVTIWK